MPRPALLIDLDGVLRHWPAEVAAEAEAASGLPSGALAKAAFSPALLGAAITGRCSDQAWRRAIVTALRQGFPDADAELAVRLWSAPAGTIDQAAVATVRACRPHLGVVLVTNATTRLPADLERLGIADLFDAVINSAQVGTAKPEPAIYAAALAAAGTPAAQALFVDDSPVNVRAARALGLAGAVHDGAAGLSRAIAAWMAGAGPLPG